MLRQKFKGECLEKLTLKNFVGLDKPLDSQLLMKVSDRVKCLEVGPMESIAENIRASFNDCLSAFIESPQPKLQELNLKDYVKTTEEAV